MKIQSFKERGARSFLLQLTEEERKRGVISASTGNHGQGLSYHANELGIRCVIVMPVTAPILKIKKCRGFNAEVVIQGKTMWETKALAHQLAKTRRMIHVNIGECEHIIAGQGTVALEICEQVPYPDVVVVPVGGGGLLAGTCIAINAISPRTKIIVRI